jgi:Membrane-bound lytic murein transglycosylase
VLARKTSSAGKFLYAMPLLAALAGCVTKPPAAIPPPAPQTPVAQALHLKPVAFADLEGWATSDPGPALSAFIRSCSVITAKPDSEAMGYGGVAGDWRQACTQALSASDARRFFESEFAPVQILDGGSEEGRFTGYFEPEIKASRSRHGAFTIPVYGRPDDLVTVDLGQFRPALKGEKIAGRVEAGKLIPYPARAAITAKGIKAPVLFYTDDAVALFFLHIQGSGRVSFDDGSSGRAVYAAQNGQPYTAIGRTLIARGVPKEGMSLQVIRAWLKAHPDEADAVMNTDASYVFFAMAPAGDPGIGAKGAEGVPLTPMASLAVDLRLHALGTPFYVAGPDPLNRLVIAQDTGGAIRGPVRGDVYFGFGAGAEAGAGTMNALGRFYALLPKAVAAKLP